MGIAPHSPLEAREEDMAVFGGIKAEKRRTYAGMVFAGLAGAVLPKDRQLAGKDIWPEFLAGRSPPPGWYDLRGMTRPSRWSRREQLDL